MSIGEIGTYFDSVADQWDSLGEPAETKQITIACLANVHAGSHVLDIGCGTGIMEPAYLQLGATRIKALDLSQKMIDNARLKFADIPEETLSFACQDALTLSTDERFTSIVMYNCYPHIMDKDALVEKVADLLVPGGRFLVAHGMSREMLAHQHAHVPETVSSTLESAQEESARWSGIFTIDEIADTPFLYFFGGEKR